MYFLNDNKIPEPSYVLATGRGLCLVWLHSYVPRAALPRWSAMQHALASMLTEFGADKRAVDAARFSNRRQPKFAGGRLPR
jgi:hypothetical protein